MTSIKMTACVAIYALTAAAMAIYLGAYLGDGQRHLPQKYAVTSY